MGTTDGHDPPTVGGLGTRKERPKLRVIVGGGGARSEHPEPPPLLRSSVSQEGKDRMLRTLRLLGAERAFLFLWNEEEFTLSEACVCDESGGEPRDRNVMWSLLDRITSQRAPLVMAGTDDQPSDALMSGITPPLRMAVAVPLVSGHDLKGVACFDKRIHRGQFGASDARAALAVLEALGLSAEHIPALHETCGGLPKMPTASAIAARVLTEISPKPERALSLGVRAELATPRLGEIHFWHAAETETTKRLVLCRITGSQTQPDLLISRVLSAHRALLLASDSSPGEQLKAMSFEIERGSGEPYALHATLIDWAGGAAQCAVWNAGEGQLSLFDGSTERPLRLEAQPLGPGARELAETTLKLARGERLRCAHGTPSLSPTSALSRWDVGLEPS